MNRVIVGLSGGVDSSVAAYLLQQEGYEVIALFMKNWHDASVTLESECPWIEDSTDALLVAEKLGIPFQVIDLSESYRERIVEYMFKEYELGRTPNPDVLCNREIKFDVFLAKALQLGADFVATGHYCQKKTSNINGEITHHLLAGADENKDQSYFLCQLKQHQLAKALFPIGHLQKSAVRAIAQEQGLITANKKDSQGLCFIGKVHLPQFLQQKLAPKEGLVIEIPKDLAIYQKEIDSKDLVNYCAPFKYLANMGKVVGKHQGAHYFTIGQRKGIGIGGSPEPLFVIATDVVENIVYVGQGDTHPGLYRKGLSMLNKEVSWLRTDLQDKNTQHYLCRIRYRQALDMAQLIIQEEKSYLLFKKAQRGVAAGQFAAWYLDNELIGSGVIHE